MTCACARSCANEFISAISMSTSTCSPARPRPSRSTATCCKPTRNPRKSSAVSWEATPVSTWGLSCACPAAGEGLPPPLPETDEDQDQLGKALDACLREALLKLDDMRHAEGRHLAEELRTRVARIGQQTDQVRDLAKTLTPAFARRLQARLKELLNGTGIEPARLAQEAALLAERSDISEELDRLRSHLQQFAKLLDGAGELGKKLDFLLQEMHREANTMLSKTPGVESEALAITGLSLEIRAEIEKLREQVQNIE